MKVWFFALGHFISFSAMANTGFLMAVGGGASRGSTQELKPAQQVIFSRAVEEIKKRGKKPKPCIVDYHEPTDSVLQGLENTLEFFENTGLEKDKIPYWFVDAEKAKSVSLAEDIKQNCNLIHLPSGNQTTILRYWKGTPLQQAIRYVFTNNGGIMGKSAGAAVLGTVGFFPEYRSATSTQAFLEGRALNSEEIQSDLFVHKKDGLGELYIETHTGDRERTARALAIFSQVFSSTKTNPLSILLDSDTAVLLQKVKGSWQGEVLGARAVEVIHSSHNSEIGTSEAGKPYFTHATSHLLLEGQKFWLSGKSRGKILSRKYHENIFKKLSRHMPCVFPEAIYGNDFASAERHSKYAVQTRTLEYPDYAKLWEVPYAWLEGDILLQKNRWSCGQFEAKAFSRANPRGVSSNRLNIQRYLLAQKPTPFFVSLPEGMKATPAHFYSGLKFIKNADAEEEISSSVFIIDAKRAHSFRKSQYIYKEYNAKLPVAIGGWQGAKLHLLPPNSTYVPNSGYVKVGK